MLYLFLSVKNVEVLLCILPILTMIENSMIFQYKTKKNWVVLMTSRASCLFTYFVPVQIIIYESEK